MPLIFVGEDFIDVFLYLLIICAVSEKSLERLT